MKKTRKWQLIFVPLNEVMHEQIIEAGRRMSSHTHNVIEEMHGVAKRNPDMIVKYEEI